MSNNFNVLSLFDGISMSRQALKNINFNVNNFFSSEIDKNALSIAKYNHKDNIQIGDVRNIDYKNGTLFSKQQFIFRGKFDILIGGSPCQNFSFAGKRKGIVTKDNIEILTLEQYLKLKEENFEFEGQSYLFWEYVRLLNSIKPKYFILENVVMDKKWENLISNTLGVEPIKINSSLFTCQNRPRLYWTNINCDPETIIDLNLRFKSIKQKEKDKSQYYSGKAIDWLVNHSLRIYEKTGRLKKLKIYEDETIINTITLSHNKKYSGQRFFAILDDTYFREDQYDRILELYNEAINTNNFIKLEILTDYDKVLKEKKCYRFITPEECELAQGLPLKYTEIVSNTARYKSIGNGFTVPVISWILNNIK